MDSQPPEPEPLDEPVDGARVRRAAALIAVSLVVIAGVGVGYLHPSFLSSGIRQAAAVPALPVQSSYQLAGLDFVSPSTGWLVAIFDDGDFLVMHTTDAGGRWTPELSGPTGGHGTFMKFFDQQDGVFALTEFRPLLYRTTDGGITWTSQAALDARASVRSWSFTDPANGWMLVQKNPLDVSTSLYRTSDAGASWVDLGSPVKTPDQAYGVDFARGGTGWLVSQSSGPYAYRSDDYGNTWAQVPLPSPTGAWPHGDQFLVSAQSVGSVGTVVIVATFPPAVGRSGTGGTIIGYPPLTVREFDGGSPVTYTYGVVSESVRFQPSDVAGWNTTQPQAPEQAQLVSLDGGGTWTSINLPASPGAIGFFDAWDWWWIGEGRWSTSADAGKTWSNPRNLAVPAPMLGSLEVLDARHAWFLAMAGARPELVSTADGGTVWRMALLPPMSGRFTP